jgi:hypothetical protein
MSYKTVTPKTDVTTGLSAKEYNQFIKDNFAASIPDLFTAKGDIAVATGIDAAIPVAVGANGAYLWADSGATAGVSWSITEKLFAGPSGSVFSMTRNGSWTDASWITGEKFDIASAYSSYTFTSPKSGYYLVMASIVLASGGSGWDGVTAPWYLKVGISINGTNYCTICHECIMYNNSNTEIDSRGCDIMSLAKNDAVRLQYLLATNRAQAAGLYWSNTAFSYGLAIAPLL